MFFVWQENLSSLGLYSCLRSDDKIVPCFKKKKQQKTQPCTCYAEFSRRVSPYHVSMATVPARARINPTRYWSLRWKWVCGAEGCHTVVELCIIGILFHLPSVREPRRPGLLVAAVSVLHCKVGSTLNMPLLRLSHAKGRGESSSGDISLLCWMPWC